MKSNKLALCIPTYNRPEVVGEFLQTILSEYTDYGIDVFFYDSSESDDTKKIIESWTAECDNLYYIRVNSNIHSNLKVYNIFREFEGSLKYEYLWVCADYIRWNQNVLEAVKKYMQSGYDLIIPNYRDVEHLGNRIYTDKNDLFLDCAWHMTLYGATILKIATMLSDVSWSTLVERYCTPDCISHSHVAFYFEKIKQMEQWKAIHLSLEKQDITFSDLRVSSGWKQNTFYIWCHCWPAMIEKLPVDYVNKRKVIKKSGINSGLLSFNQLKELRKENILNIQVYRLYKKRWECLTEVSKLQIFLLSILSPEFIVKCEEFKEHLIKVRLKNFCARHNKIYIYGAGKIAQRYTGYLKELNIDFDSYLVSKTTGFDDMVNGHKVILFENELLKDKHTGILLALNKQNTKEVLIKKLSYTNGRHIFCEFRMSNLK